MGNSLMALSLRAGVTFCESGGRFIFLDLRNDRYLALSGDAEQAFTMISRGEELDPNSARAAERLVEDGLLERSSAASKARPCAAPPEATISLADERGAAHSAAVAHAAARVAFSAAASRLLRLETRVDQLKRRKAKMVERGLHEGALLRIARAFNLLDLLTTPHDQCVPRSLALAHALLDRGIAPSLIFGVRLRPFGAHSWVQVDNLLVNEALDEVRNFTPILVV